MGQKVLLFDADLGMANIDILLNLHPEHDILDVISGEKTVGEVVIEGPGGICLVPGASGLQQLAYLSDSQFNRIITGFNEIEKDYDYMLIDTGAGLSRNVTDFLLASEEVFLITTTEPHAIMDAYSIIKVMTDLNARKDIHLVVNKCESVSEANSVAEKIVGTCSKFLGVDIKSSGYILEDRSVSKSIKLRIPLLFSFPDSKAANCIRDIASAYLGCSTSKDTETGISGFFSRLRKRFNV
jgi:flagellar biosynthesis protein FlhG